MTPGLPSIVPQLEPLPLPGPVWLMSGLLMLTFFLHVIAMNLLVGGSVLALYARLRRASDGPARAFVARFVKLAPVLVAATVTFGVAPLLFLQVLYGRVFFVSSILMAWLWLAVVPAVIALYYGAYAMAMRRGSATPVWLHVVSVGLLLGIALMYTTNMTLMLQTGRFGELYAASGRGLHVNFGDATFWPRWLHMMLGAMSVAGLAAAMYGTFLRGDPAMSDWLRRHGAGIAAAATAANLAVGVWWAAALPSTILRRFEGATVSGVVLVAGAAIGVLTCVLLLALRRRSASPGLALAAAGAMALTIVPMIFTRDAIRTASLADAGYAMPDWIAPQLVPIALFFVLLVAAIATVVWMIAVLLRAPDRPLKNAA